MWLALVVGVTGCTRSDREDVDAEGSSSDAGVPPSGGGRGASGAGGGGAGFGAVAGGHRASSGAGGGGAAPTAGTGAVNAAILSGDEDAGASLPEPAELPHAANPFVLAEHDPLSTFGADVDTASYDIFTRDLALGRLPLPSATSRISACSPRSCTSPRT
jgi:hypothetical protein